MPDIKSPTCSDADKAAERGSLEESRNLDQEQNSRPKKDGYRQGSIQEARSADKKEPEKKPGERFRG